MSENDIRQERAVFGQKAPSHRRIALDDTKLRLRTVNERTVRNKGLQTILSKVQASKFRCLTQGVRHNSNVKVSANLQGNCGAIVPAMYSGIFRGNVPWISTRTRVVCSEILYISTGDGFPNTSSAWNSEYWGQFWSSRPTKCEDTFTFSRTRDFLRREKCPSHTMVNGAISSWVMPSFNLYSTPLIWFSRGSSSNLLTVPSI